jgi:hypothetical protein
VTLFQFINISMNSKLSEVHTDAFLSSQDRVESIDLRRNALTTLVLLDKLDAFPVLRFFSIGENAIKGTIRVRNKFKLIWLRRI